MARYIPALLALFLLSGCSLFSKSGGKGGYGLPPVPISLLTLEDTSLAEEISLLGEGRSRSDSSLNSLTTGVVSQLLVDVGDEVTAGQAVAYLDGTDQRIALAEAEARLAESKSRLAELVNGTRPEVLAQREAEHRAALARVKEAESSLKAVRALAPQLLKQVEGDYLASKAAEQDAADEYRRTQELVRQGALSKRELVRLKAAWDRARGELVRAEQARSVQQTSNSRDEANSMAALELARADASRYQAQMAEAQEGPRAEVITAQREIVAALEAARDKALVDFQRATIKSNTDGTVKSRLVAVGDRVEAGDTIFELGGENVEFYFDVPERVQGRVKRGQTVLLRAGSEGKTVEGEVVGVAGAVDLQSRRQSIRVKAEKADVLAGAAVTGTLLIPVEGDYLVSHRDALVDKMDQWVIYTVDSENKAVEHQVDRLAGVGEKVALKTSLKAGTKIVGRGAPGLSPGRPVMLPQPEPSATPTAGATPK